MRLRAGVAPRAGHNRVLDPSVRPRHRVDGCVALRGVRPGLDASLWRCQGSSTAQSLTSVGASAWVLLRAQIFQVNALTGSLRFHLFGIERSDKGN
jgi:hypothetical protein